MPSQRLERVRAQGHSVGQIILVDTATILERAAGTAHIPDPATMKTIYDRMRRCDDGLLPLHRTSLLSSRLWNR